MTKDILAECPKCNLRVKGEEEIEKKFGWREVGGKTIPQSWCRRCRSGKPVEVKKEEPEKIDKSLWSSLQSYADRLHDLESLRYLFTKPDGLNYNYKNQILPTENWSKEAKRIISENHVEIRIIAEKNDFDVIYIEIPTNEEVKWKRLASEVFSRHAGYALVISHNPNGYKWLFTGNSGKDVGIAKHIPVEIGNKKAPPAFIDWLYKIRVEEDDTLLRILAKFDGAFDEFALDIQDKLGDNVFAGLKALIQGAIFNKSNGLKFDNETLLNVREPLFTLLYRLMFVLYAESRGVFNIDNTTYYEKFSLRKISNEFIRIWERNPKELKLKEYEIWNRFVQLFHLVESGSKPLNFDESEFKMLAYNGSLFNSDLHQELEKWKFDNNSLLEAIHYLTRVQDREKNLSFVNYAAIEIRHIGTIYEKLLEFHPEKVKDKIEIFTSEGKREAEGTYYTPQFIVDNIVKNALGPLVDRIINVNSSPDEKIEAILRLKILDPAIGSGHFLVGAANYLAKRILEISPDKSEQNFVNLKRRIVRQCLYGVDINPLSVELAKVSLWLDTLSEEHALSFLATHLKNGDSIKSAWRKDIFDQQTSLGEDPSRSYFRNFVKTYTAFETIDDHLASTVKSKTEEEKDSRRPGSNYDQIKYLLDAQIAKYYGREIKAWRDLRSKIGTKEFQEIVKKPNWINVRQIANKERFFHWELEFPQVFFDQNGDWLPNAGFDVIIGNPPYGIKYDNEYYLSFNLGSKESYGFFMFQCLRLLKNGGIFSMVISDTWRTLRTHLPLRSLIITTSKIKRLVKLNRYAFKTFKKNIDAFTIITELEKGTDEENFYYYYDFWQVHPLKEREYFYNLMNQATYLKEKEDWPFDKKRTMRYLIHQNSIKRSETMPIFEGSEEIFKLFDKNAPIKYVEIK